MIVQRAKPVGAGVEWGDTTDIISGSAGTGLYLLYAAREFQQPALAQLAAGRARGSSNSPARRGPA